MARLSKRINPSSYQQLVNSQFCDDQTDSRTYIDIRHLAKWLILRPCFTLDIRECSRLDEFIWDLLLMQDRSDSTATAGDCGGVQFEDHDVQSLVGMVSLYH